MSEIILLRKLEVMFLQETQRDSEDDVEWGLWWKGKSFFSHGTNTSAGVAVLFSAN